MPLGLFLFFFFGGHLPQTSALPKKIPASNLRSFRNTLTKRGIFLFGKKLSLLIVTLTGTDVGSKRLSI